MKIPRCASTGGDPFELTVVFCGALVVAREDVLLSLRRFVVLSAKAGIL